MSELDVFKIVAAARDFLPRLDGTIRHSDYFNTVYSIRSRVKNPTRLNEKIAQKRDAGRADYCLDHVSDVIGIRFISLYRQDMAAAIMHALELVTGDTKVNPNAFHNAELLEFKSYTSNSIAEQDAVNIELRSFYEPDIERKTGIKLELIPRSRYSSVHMVLKVPIEHDGAKYAIAIELQFRSVFEDAWAEIDHKLLYELGRDGRAVDEIKREAIAQHMTILKKMVDTAADYADVIRRTVIDPTERPTNIPRNLDGADYLKALADRAGLDDGICKKLTDVLAEKTEVDAHIERGSAETSKGRYLDVAKKLMSLQSLIEPENAKGDKEAMRAIEFSVRMEIALCRLLSEDDGQLRLAIDGYQMIVKEFPSYPGGWFRSGQALQRQSALLDATSDEARVAAQLAFEHFGQAWDTLTACKRFPKPQRIITISPLQEEYIARNARRLRSFGKWRLVDRREQAGCEPTMQDLDDLLTAFSTNQIALADETESKLKLTLANNSAYYATEAIRMSAKLGVSRDDMPTQAALRDLLRLIEKDAAESDDVMMLNTLVQSYVTIGNDEKAIEMARRILDLNADQGNLTKARPATAYILEAVDRAIKNAWRVVRAAR